MFYVPKIWLNQLFYYLNEKTVLKILRFLGFILTFISNYVIIINTDDNLNLRLIINIFILFPVFYYHIILILNFIEIEKFTHLYS